MTEKDKDNFAFYDLFAEARGVAAEPGEDLMVRILADAARVQARPEAVAPVLVSMGGWRNWLAAIGGWPAAGGIALATVAGVWIGVAAPTGLATLASGVWGETVTVELYADDDLLGLLEG
ncbi:MAG: hypothetical protein NTX73_07375 [Rhodobacterales bacterium]|jgi:hypothetical protein|nr:hypothetical protein [Rhodobacterales bacterium]